MRLRKYRDAVAHLNDELLYTPSGVADHLFSRGVLKDKIERERVRKTLGYFSRNNMGEADAIIQNKNQQLKAWTGLSWKRKYVG